MAFRNIAKITSGSLRPICRSQPPVYNEPEINYNELNNRNLWKTKGFILNSSKQQIANKLNMESQDITQFGNQSLISGIPGSNLTKNVSHYTNKSDQPMCTPTPASAMEKPELKNYQFKNVLPADKIKANEENYLTKNTPYAIKKQDPLNSKINATLIAPKEKIMSPITLKTNKTKKICTANTTKEIKDTAASAKTTDLKSSEEQLMKKGTGQKFVNISNELLKFTPKVNYRARNQKNQEFFVKEFSDSACCKLRKNNTKSRYAEGMVNSLKYTPNKLISLFKWKDHHEKKY